MSHVSRDTRLAGSGWDLCDSCVLLEATRSQVRYMRHPKGLEMPVFRQLPSFLHSYTLCLYQSWAVFAAVTEVLSRWGLAKLF